VELATQLIVIAAAIGIWLALQLWILPKLGIST
jgi:hypothetical protein